MPRTEPTLEQIHALRMEMLDHRKKAKELQIQLDNRHGKLHCEVIPDFGFPQGTGDLEVHFGYEPAERETRDEPGCHESFDITAVYIQTRDGWMDIYLTMSEDQLMDIEQCLSEMRADGE